MDEAALVQRAVQGDAQAWEPLVAAHQEAVFRYGYLILGDAAEAEDVAQEAFTRAYRALGRFDASRPLRPWLLAIAANLARNRQRSAGRYWAALQRWFYAGNPASASVEEQSFERMQAGSLWEAVRRLGTDDQQVIYLRYFLDLSVEETAAAANIAPGTVKSRLHRALKRLKDVIEREFPGLRENQD